MIKLGSKESKTTIYAGKEGEFFKAELGNGDFAIFGTDGIIYDYEIEDLIDRLIKFTKAPFVRKESNRLKL